MRHIDKSTVVEPASLTAWKIHNPYKTYKDLDKQIRQDIRQQALIDQYYLCAYCCRRLADITECHNEHIESQHNAPTLTLNYTNIVVSCNTKKQCGEAHQHQHLPLTPLMPECEAELRFKLSGRVEGLTIRAQHMINVLNLGSNTAPNKSLIEARKQLVESLLLVKGVNPNEGLEDDELLQLVLDDLSHPKEGKLEAFAPVAINILRQWTKPL